jgi:transcriptional regulator with XRE-family HTH domain
VSSLFDSSLIDITGNINYFRRVSKRPSSSILRREIATCLKAAIRDNNLKKRDAAKLLGITRQSLWLYLNEKSAPGSEVLRIASELWNLTLSNGYVLKTEAFGPKKKLKTHAKQLNLLRALDEIKPSQIQTELVGRTGSFVEFRIRIKAAS